jgi:hypothetical protein
MIAFERMTGVFAIAGVGFDILLILKIILT